MLEKLYTRILDKVSSLYTRMAPYIRRSIRFMALPYCYFGLINWQVCDKSRYRVALDLWYIFFKLKTFPDFYSPCRLWEVERKQWGEYYGSIYDAYQRQRLRREVQPADYLIIFNDKEVCHNLFCRANGLPVTEQYATLEPGNGYRAAIKAILNENGEDRVIIKPTRGSSGRGIMLAKRDSGRVFVQSGKNNIPLDKFQLAERSVVEKIVTQHPDLAKIAASSTNTVRMVTLLDRKSQVLIVGALMRFSATGSFVDNWSAGGVAVGVDIAAGRLKNLAYDKHGRRYDRHPISQFVFGGFEIPFWDEVIALAKRVQAASPYYKLLGMDIAITETGPVLIEVNPEPDNILMEQTFGPILRNPQVKQAFREYNLLLH